MILGSSVTRLMTSSIPSSTLSALPDFALWRIASFAAPADLHSLHLVNRRLHAALASTPCKVLWILERDEALRAWAGSFEESRARTVGEWLTMLSDRTGGTKRKQRQSTAKNPLDDAAVIGHYVSSSPTLSVFLLSLLRAANDSLPDKALVPRLIRDLEQDHATGLDDLFNFARQVQHLSAFRFLRRSESGRGGLFRAVWSALCRGLATDRLLNEVFADVDGQARTIKADLAPVELHRAGSVRDPIAARSGGGPGDGPGSAPVTLSRKPRRASENFPGAASAAVTSAIAALELEAGRSDRQSILEKMLDEEGWREAFYAAITGHNETPALLRALIALGGYGRRTSSASLGNGKGGSSGLVASANSFSTAPALVTGRVIHYDLKLVARDAPVLAAHLGRLGALKDMVEHMKWSFADDSEGTATPPPAVFGGGSGCGSLEILRAAASNGHWPVVLYVVGLSGFSEHHEGLVYTYRGLYILGQCGEHKTFDSVTTVLDGWRADEEAWKKSEAAKGLTVGAADPARNTRRFGNRWNVAMEMACEKGLTDLAVFLCGERKGEEVSSLGITARMFALAVGGKHWKTADAILAIRAADDSLSGKDSTTAIEDGMKDILAGGVAKREEWPKLLRRYCVTPSHLLAPQLGLKISPISAIDGVQLTRDWENARSYPTSVHGSSERLYADTWHLPTENHRALAVRFFLVEAPKPVSLAPKVAEELVWGAVSAGNVEAAYAIRDAGISVKLDWMESAFSSSANAPPNKDTAGASVAMPPATAMVLLSALGGAWQPQQFSFPNPRNSNAGSTSAMANSPDLTSKANLDLGAILIAAELSKAKARFTAEEFETVSETLTRDTSFVEMMARPHAARLLMNVEDSMWTAFLTGKLDEVKAKMVEEGKEVPAFSWMEPPPDVASLPGSTGSVASGTQRSPGVLESMDFDEANPESVQVLVGLGGKLPEKTPSTKMTLKQKALRRVINSEL
ncbi:hypothetical protein HDU96_000091 [Phlyctochytrium bullatum]|nr:hypothetical protein HDU96_000091 [Phlyctochytrium bullatum]